jgi:superfamily II DNA/RNA helicase
MRLAKKIYELESFRIQYDAIVTISVCDTIPNLNWSESKYAISSKINWNNILSIASILSYSNDSQHLDAALRIAQTCLTQDNCNQTQKHAATIILNNLTNKPAISLAVKRNYIQSNYNENYPTTIKLQNFKSDFENTVIINDNILSLNRFQKEVYQSHKKNKSISISAPTSAGKSFILCNIILEKLLDNIINIVYLVPTRALINQVESDIRHLIKQNKLEEKVSISTVPPQEILDEKTSNVFIFTQERLHWFLTGGHSVKLDLLIIDEAHKIEDGNRGILLQQKLEDVVDFNPSVEVYFSSPFTSNPEILLENVNNTTKKDSVNTQFVSVNQNLLFVSQCYRKPTEWKIELCITGKIISLGTIHLQNRPAGESHKMVSIVERFSDKSASNIIYCNGAAEAEQTSLLLYDLLESIENDISEEIDSLIKLIKKTIHSQYSLAKVLQKGIAFHYGNMPLLVREEIERLFSKGEIKYLICTSTLLEGVNLPAKTIFIKKPKRGKSNPLDQNDFWNLAGRAGRWGKEFSGNIVCIEPDKWDEKSRPTSNKSKQVIKRAINIIENSGDELLNYIKEGSPRNIAENRQDLEFAFGYYYIKYIIDKNTVPETEFYKDLLYELKLVEENISIPDSIIKKNPGISPIAQQSLLDYFNENIQRIEEFIPVYPSEECAYSEYINFVGRIGKTISCYPPQLNCSRSILLINWMTGKPLSYLIRRSFESYQKNGNNRKNLPTVIREVMYDVENFVRFQFAKDSNCYIDILRYILEINSRNDLLENIPQLNLWLEFGVSQKTHISLLSLGLSRNTVVELTNYIIDTTMTKEESLQWLKKQELDILDLSPIIIADIKKVISL